MRLKNKLKRNLLFFFIPEIVVGSVIDCSFFGIGRDKPLVLNGTIEADDILVGSKIGGRVTEVLVDEGEVVKEGDALIRLDDAELTARRDQILASIKQAEEHVREREANLELLLNGNRKEEIGRAKADWKSVRADLDLAVKDEKRNETLYEKGIISRQERDSTASRVNVLKEQAKSAEETYDLLNSGFRKEEIAQAKAGLTQAEAALEQARFSLNEIDVQLKEMTVRAPMDAIV